MYLFGIIVLFVIVIALKTLDSSKGFTGKLGEYGVRRRLEKLDSTRYRVINDLMVPHHRGGDKTSQIDHVVVCEGGIAVIETKNWAGRIFGTGSERYWTIALGRRKYRHLNPVLQNEGHIKSLYAIVGDVPMYNIVVFGGRADLRLRDVDNAMVIRPSSLEKVISGIRAERIINVEEVYQRLLVANITNKESRQRHVSNIRKDFHQ